MKTYVLALAVSAAIGFSGVAFDGEATKPVAMSDSEMDNVTAGNARMLQMCNQQGLHCLLVGGGPNGQGSQRLQNNGYIHSNGNRGARFRNLP